MQLRFQIFCKIVNSNLSNSNIHLVRTFLFVSETCSQVNCNNPATLRCVDCEDIYCSKCCDTLHKAARGLQKHRVLPIVEAEIQNLVIEKCPSHPNYPLELKCVTCDIILCTYCLIEGHNGHKYDKVIQSVRFLYTYYLVLGTFVK